MTTRRSRSIDASSGLPGLGFSLCSYQCMDLVPTLPQEARGQICLPGCVLLVSLAARCPIVCVEFSLLVRILDESREDFLRGSPLRSTSTTARRKGYVHGRGCLEGAWSSTRPQRELRGVRARPALSRCGGRETSRFDEGRTESCPTAQRKRFAALQLV